jgi:exodeoxyribonuclease V gamma subunit
MRSVPHRVVCLLGLDDGVFPRQPSQDGDDVLARDPWAGERDPRSEDRQLFLDAICAAEEHLVITYTGADERTGAAVPPAVPLGELLDALDRTATAPDGKRVRDVITTHHPLQPFAPRNFEPRALAQERAFSFDPLSYAGARAAAGPRAEPSQVIGGALPAPAAGDVDLADLRRLLTHPARGFLRQRLQVAETRGEDEPADALPVELDALEKWEVGDRVLREGSTASPPPSASTWSGRVATCRRAGSATTCCARSATRSTTCCWPRRSSGSSHRSRTTSTCPWPTAAGSSAPWATSAVTSCSR